MSTVSQPDEPHLRLFSVIDVALADVRPLDLNQFVIEGLSDEEWDAAWCFYEEGDRAAEEWVKEKVLAVLDGKAGLVAAAIKRKATNLGLAVKDRKNADTCASYLHAKTPYLDYPKVLASGWPVATGVIEGACRYLVKDRLALSGERWRLEGAEAILKLRAVRMHLIVWPQGQGQPSVP